MRILIKSARGPPLLLPPPDPDERGPERGPEDNAPIELSWERRLCGVTLPEMFVMLRPRGIIEVLGTKLGGETPREGGREADFLSTTNSILFWEKI